MTGVRDLGIEERYTPTVEMLPDGWRHADEGVYNKIEQDDDILNGRPYCVWELTYNGYRITIESGITGESYRTVEKDPLDRLWAGVRMAHLPRQYIESDML